MIIDLEKAKYVNYANNNIKITNLEGDIKKHCLNDISCIILSSNRLSISKKCLSKISEKIIPVILTSDCGAAESIIMPLKFHSTQSKILRKQVDKIETEFNDLLWKDIIKSKIQNQAEVLELHRNKKQCLLGYMKEVNIGDKENVEAQASKKYWSFLFENFKRDRFSSDENKFLNYGYSILRGIVSKYSLATGLNPNFGVHHCNQYNPYPLVDDIMEPFRPSVDLAIRLMLNGGIVPDEPLNKNTKGLIFNFLNYKVIHNNKTYSLKAFIKAYCESIKNSYMKNNMLILKNFIISK